MEASTGWIGPGVPRQAAHGAPRRPAARRGRIWAAAALGLATVLALGPPAARASGGKGIAVFRLSGPVAEAPLPWDVFGFEDRLVFPQLLDALDAATRDPNVKTLLLRFAGARFGFAQLTELAGALNHARAAKGKQVVVHMDAGQGVELLAATAADRVNLAPEGSVWLGGLRVEVSFYKDLLDKLGVQADLLAVGRYKSAPEAFTRSDISPAAREALDALLDSLYDSLVQGVARNRKLTPKAIEAIIDVGLLTAQEAQAKRLADTTSSWPELVAELQGRAGAEAQLAFPKLPKLPDISSFFGLLELLTKRPEGASAGGDAVVAVVPLEGPIVTGGADRGLWGPEDLIASDDVLRLLKKVGEDPRSKAVVARIDSPGGSALASDLIWGALRRLNKKVPVVASLGNVAASGGYYIASAARTIVAEPTSVTGSIGVFGGKLVTRGLRHKLGVRRLVLRRGKNAGMFSSAAPFTDAERAVLRGTLQHTYDTFVRRVAKGRHMSHAAVHAVAQGRVWTGAQAKEVGLVDHLGGLRMAVGLAAVMGKVKATSGHVPVVTFPEPRSLLEVLQDERGSVLAPGLGRGLGRRLGWGLGQALGLLLPAAGGPPSATTLGRALGLWLASAGSPSLAGLPALLTTLTREPTAAMLPFALDIR